jgi:hypothetical protein
MPLNCPHCRRELPASSDPPSFCMYCGKSLRVADLTATVAFDDPASGSNGANGGGMQVRSETIAGYRIVRLLGQGGMGSVHEAEELASGRRVALKLIHADVTEDSPAVARFRREGQLASTLTHPRCVFVLAADEADGIPYIAMELMPGRTLKELIEQGGPLPPAAAVLKILDVIEGLRAAHKLGMIHRDVKPSNCFLEADGRVKVGDFGLSKMLAADKGLTRTGAFLGTVAYASPEQIRKDALDLRTDVYSLSATLYYLLAGRPPFPDEDAAAALARIVSEPAPSLRLLRPELPPALDRLVLKGLERDRERRWRNLDEMRAALLPFVPGRATLADLRRRFFAALGDLLVLSVGEFGIRFALITAGFASAANGAIIGSGESFGWAVADSTVTMGWPFLYFWCQESWLGATLGKRLQRIRVYGSRAGQPPGPGRTSLRTLIFLAFTIFPSNLLAFWLASDDLTTLALMLACDFVGIMLLFLGARQSNGYRGLHEWASGTWTVGLPHEPRLHWRGRQRVWAGDAPTVLDVGPITGDVPETLGPFAVRGPLRWAGEDRLIAATDPSLKRDVWIVVQPSDSEPLPHARRELARPARLRWLTGARTERWTWDAYLAPKGRPLTEVVRRVGAFDWADTRHILEILGEELDEAGRDGTIPRRLVPEQVWLQPDGAIQLIDAPLHPGRDRPEPAEPAAFLGRVARLALDNTTGDLLARRPIRAPVPKHARPLLDRLTSDGSGGRVGSISKIRQELEETRNLPTHVNLAARLIAVWTFLASSASLITIVLLIVTLFMENPIEVREFAGSRHGPAFLHDPAGARHLGRLIVYAALLMPPFWELVTCGGLLRHFLGIQLVRTYGRPLTRALAAARGLFVWAPIWMMLGLDRWLKYPPPIELDWAPSWVSWSLLGIPIWLFLCALPALFPSGRMLQDRATGVYPVPE